MSQRLSESVRGGKEKRGVSFFGAVETGKELGKWRRLQQKSLNILVLLIWKG